MSTSMEIPQCLVCYTDLTHPCVTPCAHNEVCGTCHLRLRHLHSDKKCPMCKQENQQIIVDRFEDMKLFEEYPLWGDELGDKFVFRDDVGMFFPNEYYESDIAALFGHHCGVCSHYDGVSPNGNGTNPIEGLQQQQQYGKKNKSTVITPVRGLQDHLRNKHRLTLCDLCIENKRDFVALLPRFTPVQLKNHMAKGDSMETGFRGHPLCEFCRPKRFYDLTHLHMHLQKDHYKCHVCDKQGLADQYFRDYQALEKHFDRQHFLCKDPQCTAARFLVFENEIDLRAHELAVHGGTSTGSTKIQLEFRVRREGYSGAGYDTQTVPSEDDFQYGVDGEAFVPEGLPVRERGPIEATSHPLHFQRTNELRAQAAGIRAAQQLGSSVEAFPSLGETSNSDGFRMGWTAPGTLQRLTRSGISSNSVEQFPSLPSASARNSSNSVASELRAGGVSGGRHFAAMRNAASIPVGASGIDWASQAATRPAAGSTPNTSFITPSAASTGSKVNRQTDLASNNFPSLGVPSQTRATYPATSFMGANQSASIPTARSMSANDFPSLGTASKTRGTYPTDTNGTTRQVASQLPPVNSTAHFPPPPKPSTKTNSVREKLLGDRKMAPTNNLLNFPPPSNQGSIQQGMATVAEMKASLGQTKYKELKNLTKEFASDGIAPHAYVDHAAALFDDGYADSDFWAFLPSLLVSCPNQSTAASALRYMDDLRAAQQKGNATQSLSTDWASSPAISAVSSTRSATFNTSNNGSHAPFAPIRPVGVATQPSLVRSSVQAKPKQAKGAWGAAGAPIAVRAKSSPISVTVAAANQTPQTGTATAFMAKEKKLQTQAQYSNTSSGNGKNKKKKAQSDELRALAFGR